MRPQWYLVLVLALTGLLSPRAGAAQVTRTITGEVIDIYCYADHGGTGTGHKDCAANCIRGGQPVGILEEGTGEIYVASGAGHGTAVETLLPYVAQKVSVTGKVIKKPGLSFIMVSTVEAAK